MISGVTLLPQCLLSGPTTAITGAVISKSGRYRTTIWAGWAVLSLGCGLLVLLDIGTSIPQWMFVNAVSGIGLGLLFASLSIATQAATSNEHMAIASGLTPFFRAIGQALGIVIGDAVFQNVLKQKLLSASSETLRQQATSLAKDAASLGLLARSMTRGSAERAELLAAFNQSLHAVWWTLTAFALFAGVLSLLIRQISLDRKDELPSPKDLETGDKGDGSEDEKSKDSLTEASEQHSKTSEPEGRRRKSVQPSSHELSQHVD